MDRMKQNPFHETEVNAGQTFAIGYDCAVDNDYGCVDFTDAADSIHGFYTTRVIEIMAVEHIVTEEHACDTIAGVVSLIDGTGVYATVTGINETAVHDHISGVLTATTRVPAGRMLYFDVTTASTDGVGEAGQGYFIVTYR